MKGCIGKRGKSWVVRIFLGQNPDTKKSKWIHKTFKTERDAQLKDRLELVLNRAVCGGKLTLAATQQCLLHDGWIACARRMHTPTP